jgi:hypothetical protein
MASDTIQLPAWLSTGMIFQQGVPFLLYGYTNTHTPVKLEVVKDPTDGRKVSKLDTDYGIIWSKETRSADDGKFEFELPAYKPTNDAYTLIFTTPGETVSIKDLRCGDVWIMLGSVPLSVPISRTGAPRTPLKDSALRLIRFFVCSRTTLNEGEEYSYNPLPSMKSCSWITVRAGAALAGVSSVGFSLAYHLADQLHYPIGIVDLALEGSAIYSWISRKSFEADEDLAAILKNRRLYMEEADWITQEKAAAAGAKKEASDTPETADGSKPETKPAEPERAAQDLPVNPAARQQGNRMILSSLPKPHVDKIAPPMPFIPRERRMTALYNHKIYPLRSMSIRGIIFAPDAGDSAFTEEYDTLVRALLTDLSTVFGPRTIKDRREIPSMMLIELHPGIVPAEDPYRYVNFNEGLSAIRRKMPMPIGLLSLHDMLLPDKAVSFYIGRRLSGIALGLHFTPKMPSSSPECTGVEIVGNKVMISFDNTGDGLKLAENESVLRGFAICGQDLVYRPAQAKILHGVRVMVWHEGIQEPTGVTYGYYPIPHDSTFRNRADLPILPFRFDRRAASYAPDLTFATCDSLTFIGLETKDSEYALLPVYEIKTGEGKIFLETLNKTEGSGSLRIEYETEDGQFAFAPILRYASLFVPLDLSSFKRVLIDIFNPDLEEKSISVTGFDDRAVIAKGLKWQTITLKHTDPEPLKISEFIMTVFDKQNKGSIYVDNIRFLP